MKNLAQLYTMYASMRYGFPSPERSTFKPVTEEEKKHKEQAKQHRLKQRGVKEFRYGSEIILARDKKNADRKARNKGLL